MLLHSGSWIGGFQGRPSHEATQGGTVSKKNQVALEFPPIDLLVLVEERLKMNTPCLLFAWLLCIVERFVVFNVDQKTNIFGAVQGPKRIVCWPHLSHSCGQQLRKRKRTKN